MTKPDVTLTRLKELLHYDPITGIFTWRINQKPRAIAGNTAGSDTGRGYLHLTIKRRHYYNHRLAWFYVHGCWPKFMIDHIDGNRRNNAIRNLRDVPKSINMQNLRRSQLGNITGLLGVSKADNRFYSRIRANGTVISLGSFATKEEAHEAYLIAKRKLHPGCTI